MDFLKRSHYFRGWFWICRGIKCSHFDQQETQKTLSYAPRVAKRPQSAGYQLRMKYFQIVSSVILPSLCLVSFGQYFN